MERRRNKVFSRVGLPLPG